jgi:hypothetical protein
MFKTKVDNDLTTICKRDRVNLKSTVVCLYIILNRTTKEGSEMNVALGHFYALCLGYTTTTSLPRNEVTEGMRFVFKR